MTTRAIWIDAEHRTVTEIQIDGLEGMQKAVGGLIEKADTFHNSKNENAGPIDLYINEEGRINGTTFGFMLTGKGAPPYFGNGLLCGVDLDTGDTIDLPEILTAAMVFERVDFGQFCETQDKKNIPFLPKHISLN